VEKRSIIKDPSPKRPEKGLTLIITAEERGPGASGPLPGVVYPFTVYIFLLIREVPLEFVEISAILSVRINSGHYLVRQPVNVFETPYQKLNKSG
jgi:hypothetical protein